MKKKQIFLSIFILFILGIFWLLSDPRTAFLDIEKESFVTELDSSYFRTHRNFYYPGFEPDLEKNINQPDNLPSVARENSLQYQKVDEKKTIVLYSDVDTGDYSYYIYDTENKIFKSLEVGEKLSKRKISLWFDGIYPHPEKDIFALSYCLGGNIGGCTRMGVAIGNYEKVEEVFFIPKGTIQWGWNGDNLHIGTGLFYDNPELWLLYLVETAKF